MIELLDAPSSCKYVLAIKGGGWEYGIETVETGKRDTKTKVKRGVASTLEDALEQNGMSIPEKETQCSGKQSAQSQDSLYKRSAPQPRSGSRSLSGSGSMTS